VVSPSWGDPEQRDKDREMQQIIRRLNLKAGMAVADIGAGDGYDSLRLARALGPAGRVYAEDISAEFLRRLGDEAGRRHLKNVTPVVGRPADPLLPPSSVDAAILVHMYHEISQPYALLYHLAASIRPGGVVGVEELDRPTGAHGTPPKLLVCEFQAVGYSLVSRSDMPGHLGYFAVFRPPAPQDLPAPETIVPCKE
jgi:ubiquinone/menaquinone biosynthesis C-methylase UbiE